MRCRFAGTRIESGEEVQGPRRPYSRWTWKGCLGRAAKAGDSRERGGKIIFSSTHTTALDLSSNPNACTLSRAATHDQTARCVVSSTCNHQDSGDRPNQGESPRFQVDTLGKAFGGHPVTEIAGAKSRRFDLPECQVPEWTIGTIPLLSPVSSHK